jgi:hypothetical protein
MSGGTLNPLLSVDKFYDYRGRPGADEDAPPIWLPVHQGDVFERVEVPGVTPSDRDDPQLAMVFMHPCTMRKAAVLTDLITMFQVRTESPRKHIDEDRLMRWFSVMPLLDLRPGVTSTHVADLMHVGVVPSSALDRAQRIASPTAKGRRLVQQRVIYHLTRLAVPLHDLALQTRAVERELELQGTWCERACERDGESADVVMAAELRFDEYMSSDNRRARLDDDSAAHLVMSEVNREVRERYSSGRR